MSKTRLLALMIIAVAVAAWANFPITVTMFVKDDEGKPVEGAEVRVTFERFFSETGGLSFTNSTNARGVWQRRELTSGNVGGIVTKKGYYMTPFEFKGLKLSTEDIQPTTHFLPATNHIILRKEINPAPMYAREVTLKVPVSGKPMGFDFMAGDWVAPDGKGKVADVVMTLSWTATDFRNWSKHFKLVFQNPGDGIVRIPTNQYYRDCSFGLPRFAPETGYEPELYEARVSTNDVVSGIPPVPLRDECFFFRIRAVKAPDGSITKALYGKIRSNYKQNGITAYGDGDTGTINFTYYLNPDGTRNMEFDPEKNLFTDFDSWESDRPKRP